MMSTDTVFSKGIHNGSKVIFVQCPYHPAFISELKQKGARWSRSKKLWYLRYNEINCRFAGIAFEKSPENLGSISQENIKAYHNFIREMELKGFSANTIRTYRAEFLSLLKLLGKVHVNLLDEERIKSYLHYCFKTLKLSENTLHSRINALKFYFESVLKRNRMFIEIPRPKRRQILPKYLSRNELISMFELTRNLKHNTMLKFCYGLGLRVSELCNVKLQHVDTDSRRVFIENSKGKKDRYIQFPDSLIIQMKMYIDRYQPKVYLFEGEKGTKYSIRSAQLVFHQAKTRAGIMKQLGIHSLRHSYATHLLESGTDIRFIQDLLGHNNIKTTLIYTRLSDTHLHAVKSPLDGLT